MTQSKHIALVSVASLCSAAAAQSFNVDFAGQAGTPGDSFGAAAGQAGIWNVFDPATDGLNQMTSISGVLTDAVLDFSTGPAALSADPGTSGDVEALLDDGVLGLGDVLTSFTVAGLQNGAYSLVVYAFTGGNAGTQTTLFVGDDMQSVGGAWSGDFEESVTHATFDLLVRDGRLEVGFVASVFGTSGIVNGFQLTLIPAPAGAAAFGLLGVLGLRRRRPSAG